MNSYFQETNIFCFILDETGLFKVNQLKHNKEECVIKKKEMKQVWKSIYIFHIYFEFIQL